VGCLILLLPVAVLVVELQLLIHIGTDIGALSAIALCGLTAATGLMIVRQQGLALFREAQAHLQSGDGDRLADDTKSGLFLLLAAVMLMIPGFLTDGLGFVLLIPGVRRAAGRHIAVRGTGFMQMHMGRGTPGGFARPGSGNSGDIDADYTDITPGGPSDSTGGGDQTNTHGAAIAKITSSENSAAHAPGDTGDQKSQPDSDTRLD